MPEEKGNEQDEKGIFEGMRYLMKPTTVEMRRRDLKKKKNERPEYIVVRREVNFKLCLFYKAKKSLIDRSNGQMKGFLSGNFSGRIR